MCKDKLKSYSPKRIVIVAFDYWFHLDERNNKLPYVCKNKEICDTVTFSVHVLLFDNRRALLLATMRCHVVSIETNYVLKHCIFLSVCAMYVLYEKGE